MRGCHWCPRYARAMPFATGYNGATAVCMFREACTNHRVFFAPWPPTITHEHTNCAYSILVVPTTAAPLCRAYECKTTLLRQHLHPPPSLSGWQERRPQDVRLARVFQNPHTLGGRDLGAAETSSVPLKPHLNPQYMQAHRN